MISRKKNKPIYQQQLSDEDNGDQKVNQKTLKSYRDYMSMRAVYDMNKRKMKRQQQNNVEKHSLAVHQHLQPQQIAVQDNQDNQSDRDNRPVVLLKNYSKENYQKFMKTTIQNVAIQRPYTDQPAQLIDALATKNKNVCVYGYGSKIQYLRNLLQNYFCDHNVWEVNGFKNTLNDKKVYNGFGQFLVDIGLTKKINSTAKDDQLQEYARIINQSNLQKPIIVLFHCLDALHFLNEDSQQDLSILFTLPNVKLVCSLDSIKIATIWHPNVKTNFNFRFILLNTGKPYIKEQVFRPNATDVREQTGQRILIVYASLNSNQKRILKLFAKRELEKSQNREYFTMETLLQQCIDNMILSNESQLRQNLLEIQDHKVVVDFEDRKDKEKIKKFYKMSQADKTVYDRVYRQKIE